MKTRSHLQAVIMAGGSGTRFWPRSRNSLPKQFLALAGEQSLLRETYERLEALVGSDNVWVVTSAQHVDRALGELPEILPSQVIGEPLGRNTAPCIGLAAQRIVQKDAHAQMLVCPADHIIRPHEAFHDTVLRAAELLRESDDSEEPWTFTFGIKPRYPATGFGYIERGKPLSGAAADSEMAENDIANNETSSRGFRVQSFKEKPSPDVAKTYLDSGRFYWNAGIFLWQASGVLRLFETYLDDLARGLVRIEAATAKDGFASALAAHFVNLPSISIDYGLLEKARHVGVVAADFNWDDVGSWAAVERYANQDSGQNSVIGQHVGVDTRRCIIVGQKRLIGTVGLEDVVVVETDDALLICHRDQTERVKDLVKALKEAGHDELL